MADHKLFAITGFSGGTSYGIQADSAAEFNQLVAELQQYPALAALFAAAVPAPGSVGPNGLDEAQAVVQAVFPQAAPVSTVGQPLPQPAVAAPVAQPAFPAATATPPTVVNPGPCAHGPRVYKDTQARGTAWRRWECAVEWKKGDKAWNDQRCAAVNA